MGLKISQWKGDYAKLISLSKYLTLVKKNAKRIENKRITNKEKAIKEYITFCYLEDTIAKAITIKEVKLKRKLRQCQLNRKK